MHRPTVAALAAVLLLATSATQAKGQIVLSLDAALRRADEAAYPNRVARGEASAEAGRALAAYRGLLPAFRVEAGWARTTDPIGAFGTTLRQRTLTAADFDPTRLNDPAPIGNWGGALVVEQPLFNADAHFGRGAASRAADAAAAAARWTRSETRRDVVKAYYGAVLAREKVETLRVATKAAAGHVRQAEQMVETGFATKSDALLARVRAGEVEAQLLEARGEADLAVQQLAVVVGVPDELDYALPDRLPAVATVRRVVDTPTVAEGGPRADVEAAHLGLAAARADAQRAKSLYLPRLNAFARLDWFSAARPFDGQEAWTAGVMVTWSPFAGAAQLSEIRAAGGRRQAAQAGAEAAVANARLEVERAETLRRVALARLEIAERAVGQSVEAERIVTRKYDGGLATVSELLDAAALRTRSELELSAAVYRAIVAEAELRHAAGQDVAGLARLDEVNEGDRS